MAGIQDPLQSEEPIAVTGPRISTPALVIMLGSTSALTGLELMRHMLSLKANDLRRVALVYIDTDDAPAALTEFRRQHNSAFQEFPLRIAVPTGISEIDRLPQTQEEWHIANLLYKVGQKELSLREAQVEAARLGLPQPLDIKDVEQQTFIQKKVPQYFANGAGGIRNNGHVASCFHYQYIYDTLERALITISRLTTDQDEARITEVQVNIVSFLGGGTGSGILADIAVIVRELLAKRMLKQRINLFCMLPEAIRGASLTDINWRKSNSTACLLELLAFSTAAAGAGGGYTKQMRNKFHRLTNDPIANEVYLVGQSGMGDAGDTARIVGLDFFQRITNASGVGFLEHSKWVDRRTLGDVDDRGLPTMFGTSCPLQVRFPAEEVATAFAQISTAHVLPLLAGYQPLPVTVSEGDRREWGKKWRNVARFDAGAGDPLAVKLPEFRRGEFEDASQGQLDMLWTRLERHERAIETQIKAIIALKSKEEVKRIDEMPLQETTGASLLHLRIQHLKRLQQEYRLALEELKERNIPRVDRRPADLEAKLTRRLPLPGILQMVTRDMAAAVCDAYNNRLLSQAKAIRHRLLEQLLKDLNRQVHEALRLSLSWFENTEAEERAKELEAMGRSSRAWQGQLEYPHPHQRHIFDLRTLRTQDGRSIATEQLYRWATGVDKPTDENATIDYQGFVSKCVEYLFRSSRAATAGGAAAEDSNALIEDHVAGARLADRVVDFFRDYYKEQFQDTNLFELLDKAAPPSPKGQTRFNQISNYLLEHLKHIKVRMASLVAFEALLSPEGLAKLDTSIYLGMHWRDGNQRTVLDRTLDALGPVTERGQTPTVEVSIDPHRLEVVYGQHAISLSTVREFYLEQNSAMEAYLVHQEDWERTKGTGLMPVHSSGEAQRLVTGAGTLGDPRPLVRRIIRQSVLQSGASYMPSAPSYASSAQGVQSGISSFMSNSVGNPPPPPLYGNNPPYPNNVPGAPAASLPPRYPSHAESTPAANLAPLYPNNAQGAPVGNSPRLNNVEGTYEDDWEERDELRPEDRKGR